MYLKILSGDAQARVLKLELENQRLEAELDEYKKDSLNSASEKMLELEKENKRLSHKVKLHHFYITDEEEVTSLKLIYFRLLYCAITWN